MKCFKFIYPVYFLIFTAALNGFLLVREIPLAMAILIGVALTFNVLAGTLASGSKSRRFRALNHGRVLLELFVYSLIPSIIAHVAYLIVLPKGRWPEVLWSALFCAAIEFVTFWNGIICVYVSSYQLGIKQRVIGAICGLIPIVNLIVLFGIIKTVKNEVVFEVEKERKNKLRAEIKVCKTRYPILMVHGVFFRDYKYFNYWGRIPKELTANGATVYYGNHQSAAAVADSAAELAERIREILRETGAEKVNIIAHSKGGLDSRYAIDNLGMGPYVASLTTINSPHRGCLFADYLLTKAPESVKETVADTYNATLRKLGDKNPDFLAAVYDLTAAKCAERPVDTPNDFGILRQSVGSVLYKAHSGKFPLNLSYVFVKHFDGENDGLVGENSFEWGEKYTLISAEDGKGISHGDVIDLGRENIPEFDVREFYVELVSDLKSRGL